MVEKKSIFCPTIVSTSVQHGADEIQHKLVQVHSSTHNKTKFNIPTHGSFDVDLQLYSQPYTSYRKNKNKTKTKDPFSMLSD